MLLQSTRNRSMLAVIALLQTLISTAHAAGSGGPEGITPLNQGWLFGGEYTPGSEAVDFADSSFQTVTIPHSVVPLGWNNYDNNTWNKVWIYRRHFDLDLLSSKWSSNAGLDSVRTFLDFDGVLTVASPTINGHPLSPHSGGYLPFTHEITDYLNNTGNVLAVVVDARWSYVNPEGSPQGPQSIDYLEPGGINRDVALRTVPSSFISDVFAKPVNVLNSSRAVVVETTIDSAKAPGQIQIHLELQDSGKVLYQTTEAAIISEAGNKTLMFNLSAPNVQLWSPDSPKLY
jgi:beta-galactosidase